jgi:hypothetical protein
MALSITKTGDWSGVAGNLRYAYVTIDFDSSYPTGGESLTAADLGMRTILDINIRPKSGLVFEYDYTNSKVLAYTQGVAHGAAGAVTLDDYPVTAGVGATSGASISREASATSPLRLGPLKEIASTDDLSSITGVRVFAWGI